MTKLTPFLPPVKESPQPRKPMTDLSPLPSSEDIWDELLETEASKRFLEEQTRKAEELLDQKQQ